MLGLFIIMLIVGFVGDWIWKANQLRRKYNLQCSIVQAMNIWREVNKQLRKENKSNVEDIAKDLLEKSKNNRP